MVRLSQATKIALAGVLIVALGLRLHLAGQRHFPTYDGAYYLQVASSLLNDASFGSNTFPPGWPALIAGAAFFSGASGPAALVTVAAYSNAILGTLSIALCFWLIAAVSRRPWAALAASSILSFLPLHVELSISDLSEISYACCLLASALAVRTARWKAAGAFLGGGYLVRPEAAVPLAVLLGIRLLRRDWRSAARLFLPWLAFYAPYGIYLTLARGAPQWSSKQGYLTEAFATSGGWSGYARLYARNSIELARQLGRILSGPGAILALLGLLSKHRLAVVYLFGLLVYPLFSFRMDARYLLPYLPFFLILATLSLVRLAHAAPRVTMLVAVPFVLATLVFSSVGEIKTFRVNREYFPALELAGEWLRQRPDVGRSTLVAARKPYVSFWSSTRFRRIPDDIQLEQIEAWCRANDVSYLVIHVGLTSTTLPQLVPLTRLGFDPSSTGLSLMKILSDPMTPGETAFVFGIGQSVG